MSGCWAPSVGDRASATTAPNVKRIRRRRIMGDLIDRHMFLPSLKRKPSQEIQRVVVLRVGSDAVVVRARPVERVVIDVLQRDLDVLPRHVVELADPAAAAGAAGRKAENRG